MQNVSELEILPMDFEELEERYGYDSAREIIHTLEKFEGIGMDSVGKLSYEERLHNVFKVMTENMTYQTRH